LTNSAPYQPVGQPRQQAVVAEREVAAPQAPIGEPTEVAPDLAGQQARHVAVVEVRQQRRREIEVDG
jgi:hypothetical protein